MVSRACLMTGVYHETSYRNGALNTRCVTIPELLGSQGYSTAMSGKWHLARLDDQSTWPNQRGFQHSYSTLIGAGSFFAPNHLIEDNKDASGDFARKDYYYTDAITDHAVGYLKQAKAGQPVFLYVAYTAAHWPLHALPEDIAKYNGRYAGGWDQLRAERFERMKKLGVIRPDTVLSPRNEDVPAWKDEAHKEWQQRRMEVYAAQVDRMDQGVGRILRTLKETGRLENTLVMFMIDNGGCHVEYTPDRKGNYLPEKTRDGRPMRVGNVPDVMPGTEDTYQSYGHGWANASNTPFRMFKQYDHEGGVHTPMIAHWPKGITKSGAITDQVAQLTDVMPTVLQLTGGTYPAEFHGNAIYLADGKSLVPVFNGERRELPSAMYFINSHGRAIRKGDWKLVKRIGGGKRAETTAKWELYDIERDPSELKNLANAMPDKVNELAGDFETWLKRNQKRP